MRSGKVWRQGCHRKDQLSQSRSGAARCAHCVTRRESCLDMRQHSAAHSQLMAKGNLLGWPMNKGTCHANFLRTISFSAPARHKAPMDTAAALMLTLQAVRNRKYLPSAFVCA